MEVSCLIPFGGDCPHRQAALEWLLPRFPDSWEVIVGRCDGPWVKAAAVTDALSRATGDLLVIHDSDVWCAELADFAATVTTWGMPHHLVHRLTPDATSAVLQGLEPNRRLEHVEKPNQGAWGGGVVVVRRDVYEDCPLDPRFVSWGQEDKSWGTALECLHGPGRRGNADLWHLWHPPQVRMSRAEGNPEGVALWRRYYAARKSPNAMRALLEEVTECPIPSTCSPSPAP